MVKKVSIENIRDGDIIAEDVVPQSANMSLVVKNTVISERVRKRLNELKVEYVVIFDSNSEENDNTKDNTTSNIVQKKQAFKQEYKKSVSNVKSVFNDIIKGEKVNLDEVIDISDTLFKNSQDIYTAIESINEIKKFDEYTYVHSINVSLYSMLLGKWLNLSESDIKKIAMAGVLHDIGKGKIDQNILNKPEKLSKEEFEIMKKHTTYGHEICSSISSISDEVKNGVLMHHEKIDGSGYPLGLKGEEISLFAKIIGICDVYDALTSKRVYKQKTTPFDTFKQMIDIGYHKLDTKIMLTFLENIGNIYIGAKVKMNTGEIGEIVFIPPTKITTPVVKVNNTCYDLSKDKKYKIEEMI